MTDCQARAVSIDEYRRARALTMDIPFGASGVEFYETAEPPATPEDFALEACWVVLNSGFRNTVANKLWPTLWPAVQRGDGAAVFRNARKVRAMETLWRDRARLHAECLNKIAEGTEAFVAWCRTLDGFGAIIPFHLAKNFGLPTAKPDVWLQRLADDCGESTQALCLRLAGATGDRIGTVDFVWWFVLSRGLLKLETTGRRFENVERGLAQ